jgi:tRNA nucleotidyltransferase (CCA-adding enzyme)
MNNIEREVLERITPKKQYKKQIEEIVKEIKKIVNQEIKKRNLPVTIELVGSIAKDTYLKDNLDIDIFIKFPTIYKKEEIGKSALSIGRAFLKNTEESYAEHPYIRGLYKEYKVEIVPCYKIEKASQKLSAVDRTPLHTKYVKENLHEKNKSDVLLFKQFLRGIGCYGAEAEIEGFSGYLCEILIIKYGDFKNLIENSVNWKFGEKIAFTKDKYPSFDTPLTFIDPVDTNRNVASAISPDKFDFFIKACKEYLKKPKTTFFFPNKVKPWSLSKIRENLENIDAQFIGIKIKRPDTIPENLYPQVRKATRSICDTSERYGFTILDSSFFIDKDFIYIIIKIKNEPLSKTYVHLGPPAKLKKHTEEFLTKWEKDPRVTKKPYEKNERLYVEIKRDYIEIKEYLKDNILELSMGRHIDKIVRIKFSILDVNDLLIENLRDFWTEYLDGKMPWER